MRTCQTDTWMSKAGVPVWENRPIFSLLWRGPILFKKPSYFHIISRKIYNCIKLMEHSGSTHGSCAYSTVERRMHNLHINILLRGYIWCYWARPGVKSSTMGWFYDDSLQIVKCGMGSKLRLLLHVILYLYILYTLDVPAILGFFFIKSGGLFFSQKASYFNLPPGLAQ